MSTNHRQHKARTSVRRFSKSLSAISILNRQSKRNALQRHRTARAAAADTVGAASAGVHDVVVASSNGGTAGSGDRDGGSAGVTSLGALVATRASAGGNHRDRTAVAGASGGAGAGAGAGPGPATSSKRGVPAPQAPGTARNGGPKVPPRPRSAAPQSALVDHSVWGRQAVLQAVIDHLEWEGMTLAKQALQDEYTSRYGVTHKAVIAPHGEQSQLLRLLNHRADTYAPAAAPKRAGRGGRGAAGSRDKEAGGGGGQDGGGRKGGSKRDPHNESLVFGSEMSNPLMALQRANRGRAAGRASQQGAGVGAGAGGGDDGSSKGGDGGKSSTNPLLAMLQRSGKSAAAPSSPDHEPSRASSKPKVAFAPGTAGGKHRSTSPTSLRARLRTDSMRRLRIQEVDTAEDMDMEGGMFQPKVRGGTLRSLVRHLAYTLSLMALDDEGLVDRADPVLDELDPTFPRTFFLTVTRFTTPYAFIRELLSYHKERTAAKDNASLFQVVTIVRHWLEHFFQHIALRDRMQLLPRLRQLLDTAVSTALSTTPPLGADLEELRALFDKAAVDIATPRATGVERALAMARSEDADEMRYRDVTNMWDVEIKDLSEQWTVLEFCMFQAIPLVEFMDKAWGEPRYEHRADHVRAFIDRFNASSLFVTATVVNGKTEKERARLIEKFIDMAVALRKLHNFTGLNAVVSGLRLDPTLKLKRSWDRVPAEKIEALQEVRKVMSEERQYKAYRVAMAEVPEGAACVPHLGVHLFDLTFIEEGNQDMLPDRETLLNFSKWRLLADCVGNLMDIQSRSYHIRYNAHVCNIINTALKEFYFHFDDDRDVVISRISAVAVRKEASGL